MTLASPAQTLSRAQTHDHIIDMLIAERAPKLAASQLWPVLRPVLYGVMDYRQARGLADAIAGLPGGAALEHVSGLLSLQVAAQGIEHIPRCGRVIVVCNHPTGIADGIAVYDALKAVRPDLCFYANADALRVAKGLGDVLIPVEWVEARRTRARTRETLQLTREAMEAERCLVIFPAGRLSRRGADGRLGDLPWQASAIALARRHDALIVPAYLSGPSSRLFHLLHRVSSELRDITVFHELLNKRGRAFELTFGAAVRPDALAGDAATAILALQTFVEQRLQQHPGLAFA
jgi:putative hemolysin